MKYYEFEYKNKLQKFLWNLNTFATGMIYTMIGFAFTISFNNLFSTYAGTFLFIASFLVGLVISIYNSCKMKGVFLFDDHIEISSIYTKKVIIPIDEITDIQEIEKYGIVGKWDTMFKGGDRVDVLKICFKNIGMVAFKIKNQDEFLEEVQKRMSSINSIK